MIKITFEQEDGTSLTAKAEEGLTLMEVAKQNNISGIDADCGGACSCATCHVYIDPRFLKTLPLMREEEENMLDFAFYVRDNSRLSCQIPIESALDGLVVCIPKT